MILFYTYVQYMARHQH